MPAYRRKGVTRFFLSRIKGEQKEPGGVFLEQAQKFFLRLRHTNAVAGSGKGGAQGFTRSRVAREQQDVFSGGSQRRFLARRPDEEQIIRREPCSLLQNKIRCVRG